VEGTKFLKFLSGYSEAEISVALSSLTSSDLASFNKHTKEIISKVETNGSGQKLQRKKNVSIQKASDMEIFDRALKTIKSNLASYDCDSVDVWNLNFDVVDNYLVLADREILTLHSKLKSVTTNVEKYKLLLCAERGKMYTQLKSSNKFANWTNYCVNVLDICSLQANRYISFYSIYANYPRIVVSGLTFTYVMEIADKLVKHLESDIDLAVMLKAPLRTTKINANMMVVAKPVEPRINIQIEKFNWNPGFELSDLVTTQRSLVQQAAVNDVVITMEQENQIVNGYDTFEV